MQILTESRGQDEASVFDLTDIIQTHGAAILRYCNSILCDYHEAQDAAQITFVKAYTKRHLYKRDAEISSWLYKISYNTCMDILRKRKFISFFEIAKESSYEILDTAMSEELRTALLTLKPRDRALVFTKVIDGVFDGVNIYFPQAGDLVLEPNSMNFPFSPGGHAMSVSAIGAIDENFHIQFLSGEYSHIHRPYLLHNNGERMEVNHAVSFRLDEGRFTACREIDEHGNWLWLGDNQYIEFVFDVNVANLHEYSLIFEDLIIEDTIVLNWNVSFELQNDITVPRPPAPAQRHLEPEEIRNIILGDIPDVIEIFDDDGELVGRIIVNFMHTHQDFIANEVRTEHLNVRFYINVFDREWSEEDWGGIGPLPDEIQRILRIAEAIGNNEDIPPDDFIHFGICLKEQPHLLPPAYRDEIMRCAELILALENVSFPID